MTTVSSHMYTTTLAQIRIAILTFTLVMLPFHAFFITWANSVLLDGIFVTVLRAWKEILLLVFALVALAELLLKRTKIRFDFVDWLMIGFVGLAVVWGFFQRGSIGQWAAGFRLDVLPLVVFLLVRRLEWPGDKMRTLAYSGAAVVIFLGLLQALVLPADFLTRFGYSLNRNEFTLGTAIASCQYLEHTQILCRAVSTFGGPTRFGTYLLVVIGLLLGLILPSRSRSGSIGKHILLAGALVAAILTYSRSVWIGLIAMLALCAYWILGRKGKYIALGLGIALALSAVIALQLRTANLHDPLRSVLLRSNSTQEHINYMKAGADALVEHPFGTGLGTAGAASRRYEKFLTENWWLQIGVETGWVGMILYAAIFGVLFWMLSKKGDWLSRGLALAVVGLAVTGMLTHSLEELATSVTLFSLSALQLRSSEVG